MARTSKRYNADSLVRGLQALQNAGLVAKFMPPHHPDSPNPNKWFVRLSSFTYSDTLWTEDQVYALVIGVRSTQIELNRLAAKARDAADSFIQSTRPVKAAEVSA